MTATPRSSSYAIRPECSNDSGASRGSPVGPGPFVVFGLTHLRAHAKPQRTQSVIFLPVALEIVARNNIGNGEVMLKHRGRNGTARAMVLMVLLVSLVAATLASPAAAADITYSSWAYKSGSTIYPGASTQTAFLAQQLEAHVALSSADLQTHYCYRGKTRGFVNGVTALCSASDQTNTYAISRGNQVWAFDGGYYTSNHTWWKNM